MSNPRVGDIIEIKTGRGLAYAQFTHQHETFGSLIRAIEGFRGSRPDDIAAVARGHTRFVTFFPLRAAVKRGIVTIVGRADVPAAARVFPVFKDGVADPRTKVVSQWWLWDGEKEWRVGSLTPEQRKLPHRAVWNDTMLVDRLESDWSPEDTDW